MLRYNHRSFSILYFIDHHLLLFNCFTHTHTVVSDSQPTPENIHINFLTFRTRFPTHQFGCGGFSISSNIPDFSTENVDSFVTHDVEVSMVGARNPFLMRARAAFAEGKVSSFKFIRKNIMLNVKDAEILSIAKSGGLKSRSLFTRVCVCVFANV